MSRTKVVTILPTITERDFAQQVVDLACLRGWLLYRTWTSLHSPRGFPDLILCKTLQDGSTPTLVVELKSEKGKLSSSQVQWLELLAKTKGIFSWVWLPSLWEELVGILQGKGLPDILQVWKRHALFARERFGLSLPTQGKE